MSRPTVLIFDDEAPYAESVGELLETYGVRVLVASDAIEALDLLQRFSPDLVLLDVHMPEVDGFTLLQWIRKHSERPDIPIHLVSGRVRLDDREEVVAAGADGFLEKPFTMQELLNLVLEYLPLVHSKMG